MVPPGITYSQEPKAMSNFSIIRDAKKLNQAVTNFARTAAQFRNEAHVVAVSVLVHANEHGQIAPLNAFFGLLLANEQRAFRTYVGRFQTAADKDGKRVPTNMAFLKFEKGEFRIDTDQPKANRGKNSAFVKHAQKRLINPDGKVYKRFLETDNVADLKEMLDGQVVTGLKSMFKRANGEVDNVKSKVTDPYLKLLSKTIEEAERIKAANG
jgi:hypothetical protein